MRTTVAAPDGSSWTVSSRWYRRPRWRAARRGEHRDGSSLDALDFVDFAAIDHPAALLAGVLLAAGVAIVILFLLPLILFVVEFVVAAILVLAIRRHWIVEAVSSGGTRRAWLVRGWLRTRRAVREVARELETGVYAEPDDALGQV